MPPWPISPSMAYRPIRVGNSTADSAGWAEPAGDGGCGTVSGKGCGSGERSRVSGASAMSFSGKVPGGSNSQDSGRPKWLPTVRCGAPLFCNRPGRRGTHLSSGGHDNPPDTGTEDNITKG